MGCALFASPFQQVKPNVPSALQSTQSLTFPALLSQLREQIRSNRIYDNYLSNSYLLDILHEYDKCYINHQSTVLILDLILDYMDFCVPQTSTTVRFQKSNFTNKMADRWMKIRNQIFFNNKDALRLLDYICRKKAGEVSQYGHCYLDLLYDFSQEQTGKVAVAVKDQCKLDLRAFCFLSNYLLKCCLKMEEKGENIVQIEHKLVERLNWLNQIHPPAPPLKESEQSFSMHQSVSTPLLNLSLPTLDLRSIPHSERQSALQTFISTAAQASTQRYGQFCDLVKDICMKEGYHFRANVKIKNMKQLKAVQRVKEKLLDKNFKKYELTSHISQNPHSKLTHFTQTEFENYRNQIKQMYNSLDKPLLFKVTDMLRGKCMFAGVDKINQCCTELKKAIEEKGFRLVQIDNRLRGKTGTSDLVLKIMIGETVAEMQLVIDLNVASYEFSHKIFQLVRSKFFTPLTTLQYFNDELSNDYFQELQAIIIQNNSASHHIDYGEKTTFKKGYQQFKELVKVIPFSINLKETHPNEIDVGLLADQIERFQRIVRLRVDSTLDGIECEQKLKNDGKYKHKMNEYAEAEKKIQTYCEEFKQKHSQLLDTRDKDGKIDQPDLFISYCQAVFLLGKINIDIGSFEKATPYYQQYIRFITNSGLAVDNEKIIDAQKALAWIAYKQGKYEQSIQIYTRCFQLQEKTHGLEHISCAQTLNSIGLVYSDQAKYTQALQYYQRCLVIKQKVTGKESLDLASTLNNIGLINNKLGKYKEAIRFYQRCLDIKEKIKGKDNIDCASILNNIGLLQQRILRYPLALQHYQRCLEIRQKVKGKDHIDVTLVLNNIGLIHFYSGNFALAISCYERCLQIKEAVRGKDSIDCAPTLNNIGEIYKDRGCYELGKQYLDRSLKIIEKNKGADSINSVYALAGLGDWHRSKYEWQSALSHYKSALNIQDKVLGKDSNSRIATLNSIAQIYINTGKIQEAFDICHTSLSFLKEQHNTQNLDYISCLINLSKAYLSTGSLQQSLNLINEAKGICQRVNLKFLHYANALTVLADISLAQNEIQTAIRNYEETLGIFSKFSYERYIQTAEKLQKCYVQTAQGQKLKSLQMRTKLIRQQKCLPLE